MNISGNYTKGKSLITIAIGTIVLLLGAIITTVVWNNNHNVCLTISLSVLTILISWLSAYMHKSSYYRMSWSDRDFAENPGCYISHCCECDNFHNPCDGNKLSKNCNFTPKS